MHFSSGAWRWLRARDLVVSAARADFIEMKDPSQSVRSTRAEQPSATLDVGFGLVSLPVSAQLAQRFLAASLVMAGLVSVFFVCRWAASPVPGASPRRDRRRRSVKV